MKTVDYSPADNKIFLTIAISMVAVFAIGMPLTAKYLSNQVNEEAVVLTATQFESATSSDGSNSKLSPASQSLALADCTAASSSSGGFRLACPDITPTYSGPQVAGEQIKSDSQTATPVYSWDNWLSAVVSLLGF